MNQERLNPTYRVLYDREAMRDTCRQGYITASYNHLTHLFGEPLQGDDFHISYNPTTSALGTDRLTGINFAGEQEEETALCHQVTTEVSALILKGDWREDYEAHIDDGYDACLQIYQEHKADHQSIWSSDYTKDKQ